MDAAFPLTLPSPSLFDGLDAAARAALLDEVEWFSLPGGQVLFEAGDPSDALYLVLAGSLGVIAGKPLERGTLVAQVGVGETVGEMGVLSARPRSASIVALRDSSLLRLAKPGFERLIDRHPEALLRVTAQLIDWLERATAGRRAAFVPRTLALLPLEPKLPAPGFADALAAALITDGRRVSVLDARAAHLDEAELDAIETGADLTIYDACAPAPGWTGMCLRRADRVLLLACGEAPAAGGVPLPGSLASLPWRIAELVLLQDEARGPIPAAPWLARVPVRGHYHLRRHSTADTARLGRYVTGRAVGLVLSGGGARGFGHLGVVKALRAAGIPLDLLGGTSIGAIIAACAALEWTDAELDARLRRAFVDSNPLDDYALPFPLVALVKGRKVTARLQENFGEVRIEDMARPYFCVASNLTTGAAAVLKEGALWRALRAGIAIPGLLPPVVMNGDVLADGAVLSNMPAEAMATMRRGPVIGVDVTHYRTLAPRPDGGRHWLRRLLLGGDYRGPGIVSLLMRAATISSDEQTRSNRAHVDVLLEPPLEGVDIRDWRAYDRAVEAGYRHAMERMPEIERALSAATGMRERCGAAL